LNAAAGLHVHAKANDLKTGAAMAAEAIDTGVAKQTLRKLVTLSRGEAL
jgi:anthranilate phosphoribosyltransferase